MRFFGNRLRLLAPVLLLLILALALPVWGAEPISLPGHLPVGESSQYNLVFFSSRSFLRNINQPGDLDSSRTEGRLTFFYGSELVGDRLPFEYSFQNFAYRTASYIAAGFMSGNERFAGQLSAAGDVLAAELHPRLFDLELFMEHIFGLTVFIPPTHEVAVGDSWHRSIQTTVTNDAIDTASAGWVKIDTTYTLQTVDKNAGVAHIVVEERRTHTDLAGDATEHRTIRRESTTFGIIEVSLETGQVLSAVAHNRLDVTRIPSYTQTFEGRASIDRLQVISDIRLERVIPSEK